MKDVLVIVNPASAGGGTGRRWAEVESRLRAAGLEVDARLTTHPMHAAELAREGIREGRRVVASAGGDGTLNEVVNGFLDQGGEPATAGTALGLVPLGSGGDFRRSFGIPLDPVEAVRLLLSGPTRRIDAGRVSFPDHDGRPQVRHFINIADAGIGGEVVNRVNRSSKRLGADATFMLASVASLLSWRNRPMRVTADGQVRDLVAQQVVVANCQYFGSGMRMAPMADPSDGMFDIILVGDVGMVENVRGLSKIKSGTHLEENNPKLESMRARRVEVTSPDAVRLDLDGEQPGLLPAVFEIVPAAIDLIVPATPVP